MPSDLTLMFKALITMEGLGRQYDPDFHVLDHLTPLVRAAIAERYRPAGVMRRGRTALAQAFNLVTSVPRDLARLLRDARRGKTRIDLDLKRLDTFGRQLDRTIDRATMGIMTASLVIGSAIVMTVHEGPSVLGIPVLTMLGLAGYVVAFFNSIWIILRHLALGQELSGATGYRGARKRRKSAIIQSASRTRNVTSSATNGAVARRGGEARFASSSSQ